MDSARRGPIAPTARKRPGPAIRWLLRVPARLYDVHAGWLLGHRFLRLTHLGRSTGRRYRTMLEVVRADPERDEYVVVAGLGERADWYRNVRAGAAIEVAVGRRRFAPVYRRLGEQEAAEVLARYEHEHRLAAPMIRRALSWLVGWDYDSSASARRKLAQQLPLLAFRPAHHAVDTRPGGPGSGEGSRSGQAATLDV
ncbi:MAG: nitroreductase family deazaflavin-dependent oxidoreductase [Actinocrinis sp.]